MYDYDFRLPKLKRKGPKELLNQPTKKNKH